MGMQVSINNNNVSAHTFERNNTPLNNMKNWEKTEKKNSVSFSIFKQKDFLNYSLATVFCKPIAFSVCFSVVYDQQDKHCISANLVFT